MIFKRLTETIQIFLLQIMI